MSVIIQQHSPIPSTRGGAAGEYQRLRSGGWQQNIWRVPTTSLGGMKNVIIDLYVLKLKNVKEEEVHV